MHDETLITWNVANWLTVVLMVFIGWWLYVGAYKLIRPLFKKDKDNE